MEYRLGTAKKIKEIGQTEPLSCPKCQETVMLPVFTNGKTDFVAEFPIVKSGKVYFTVCPRCCAAFGIATRAGKTFSKGEPLAIGNFDFIDLKEFHTE